MPECITTGKAMPYRTLGARAAKGASDTTGFNPGNWTVQFTPQIINVSTQIPEFEVYKIILKGAATSASFDLYIDTNLWDTNVYAAQNSWEPASGLLILRAGQYLNFYYNSLATDGHQPQVTIWLRHEISLVQLFPQQQGGGL